VVDATRLAAARFVEPLTAPTIFFPARRRDEPFLGVGMAGHSLGVGLRAVPSGTVVGDAAGVLHGTLRGGRGPTRGVTLRYGM